MDLTNPICLKIGEGGNILFFFSFLLGRQQNCNCYAYSPAANGGSILHIINQMFGVSCL